MLALALGFLAAVLAIEIGSAQQLVTLSCQGTANWAEERIVNQEVRDVTFVVNLAHRTVSGLFGSYRIKEVTPDRVVFNKLRMEQGRITGNITGRINRISGQTTLYGSRLAAPSEVLFSFILTCKPRRQLF